MRKYLIEAPSYASMCGGIKSLHKLCHKLNERGITAYMSCDYTNPEFNTPKVNILGVEEQKELQQTGIVVYPDIIPNNPHHFTHCVKWWLGATQPHSPNQLVFAFQEMHQVIVKADLNLCIIHIEDFFKEPDSEVENRHTTCCYPGKGSGINIKPVPEIGSPDLHVPGCFMISSGSPSKREELSSLLQQSKVFYTYDNLTVMMAEARLCGTPVILMGHFVLSELDFIKDPFGMSGIGMYDDKPDLEELKKQLPEFREKYKKREDLTEKELDIFIEETQKWNHMNKYVDDPGPLTSIIKTFRTR